MPQTHPLRRQLALVLPMLLLPVTAVLGAEPAAHAATSSAGAASAAAARSTVLARDVRRAMRGSTARHVRYRFQVQGTGTVSRDGRGMSAPASNEKVLTAITLLDEVGSGFRYVTTVGTGGQLVDGTLGGDLVIVGSGDPELRRADLAELARQLHGEGIRRVTGRLLIDDHRYGHRTVAHGWKGSFVPQETGPVDAFTVDRNTWRHGRSFDADPTPANAGLWRSILQRHHISVAGATTIGKSPSTLTVLAQHTSQPLSGLLQNTLAQSDNFQAEMLFREAGAERSGHGTLQTGAAAVRAEARRLHVGIGRVYDGSGLSYADRESPRALEGWLAAETRRRDYQTVYAALPVSCRTGTLQHRLCGPHVRGRVHAKTGTLDRVNALTGWTTTLDGRRITFSVLLSGVRDATKALRHLDSAVAAAVRSG